MVLKPICQHCVAEVQLFKRCRILSSGTVLQRCGCLSSIETYLPAQYCRGAAVKVVLKPICRQCVAEVQLKPICPHCVAEVQLFKRCRNPSARHSAAGVQLFKQCRNLSASTVLQGYSCLSSVETYLPGLCCRGAAV